MGTRLDKVTLEIDEGLSEGSTKLTNLVAKVGPYALSLFRPSMAGSCGGASSLPQPVATSFRILEQRTTAVLFNGYDVT